MVKSTCVSLLLVLLSLFSFAQNHQKNFKEALEKDDTTAQARILTAWQDASPKDPELFIAYFNHYVRKSKSEIISIDGTQKEPNSFVLADTGTGKPVGFLNSSVHYRSDILQQGFDQIAQGIALYPTRLDMRFGRIYMLGEAENYPEFAKEIIATIEYGNKINNAWLWKENKPLDKPKEFVLSSIQNYIATIYNTEDDRLLPLMRQISESVIRYFPDHIESLSNIALTYLITGDFDKALPYLLKAEQINPKDVIVLNNLAEAYKRKGDKENAKAYFQKVIKYGNKEEVEDAKQKIKSL